MARNREGVEASASIRWDTDTAVGMLAIVALLMLVGLRLGFRIPTP